MDWRAQFQISKSRLFVRGGLLLAGAGLLISLWILPTFCRMDAYRPQTQRELEKVLERRLSIGHLYLKILPSPGVLATDVVIFDPRGNDEPQIQVGRARLLFHLRSLLRLKPHLKEIDLEAPRLIVRRRQKSWALLKQSLIIPQFNPVEPGALGLETFIIRHGQIDWIDETTTPAVRLPIDGVFLRYDIRRRRADLQAYAPWLGPASSVRGHYERSGAVPLRLTLGRVSTQFLSPYVPVAGEWLDSSMELILTAHPGPNPGEAPDSLAIEIDHALLKPLPKIPLSGQVYLNSSGITADFRAENLQPLMHFHADLPWPQAPFEIKATLRGLAAPVVKTFNLPAWLVQPEGTGRLDGVFQVRSGNLPVTWRVEGGDFNMASTAFHLDKLVCARSDEGVNVHVEASNGPGGTVVDWTQAAGQAASTLHVDVISATVRQILEVFLLQRAGTVWPGYERILIEKGSLRGRIVPGDRFEIQRSAFSIRGRGSLRVQGSVDLSRRPANAHFQGTARRLALAPFDLALLSTSTLRIAHVTDARFDVQLPLTRGWVRQLQGQADGELALPWPADVSWSQTSGTSTVKWEVDAASVTVREVVRVFGLEQSSSTIPAGAVFKPAGYEDLQLGKFQVKGRLEEEKRLEITRAHLILEGGALDVAGEVVLSTRPAQAAFHGSAQNVPVDRIVERLWTGPPVLSGSGKTHFDLQFPLSAGWIQGLNGHASVHVEKGVLAALKNFYRVLAFTNLTNYLTFRFPNSSAQGVPFDLVDGDLTFKQGVLTTNNLFLASPDMKMAAGGALNIPAQTIHAVVKFQVFRFIENIVTRIPGIHWLFRNGHKILLPVPVHLDGPLNDVQLS